MRITDLQARPFPYLAGQMMKQYGHSKSRSPVAAFGGEGSLMPRPVRSRAVVA